MGPTRVPLPTGASYTGLAVDGNGTAWFAGNASIDCYLPGRPVQEFPLEGDSNPGTMRTAPDGSVWFTDGGAGHLGRIGRDGVLSEVQVDGHPYSDLAAGPDGSIWFGAEYQPANGVARLRPDGRVTTYPVPKGTTITVDSHGTAWIIAIPSSSGEGEGAARITDSGQVSLLTIPFPVMQLAEASDGRMWFVKMGCVPGPQIGWVDASGQTRLFDATIVNISGFPNSVVRAPDGAVWFTTSNERLIRLASETDVTVYSLPWSDARMGPFVVLPGNHILMLGYQELLDFTALNGTRVAGAQAIPSALPHIPKDAAEGAAYAVAFQASGATAQIALSSSMQGDHAALFVYSVNPNPFDLNPPGSCGSPMFVYVVEDSGGWRKYDVFASRERELPGDGRAEVVRFRRGCLNVHESPSVGSKVVACLQSGTQVTIDQSPPVFADGYIWWRITSLGWAVQPYLYCNESMYSTVPQC